MTVSALWVLATLVKGTVVLLAVILVAGSLHRASAALRHLVWGTGIVTLLALPFVSLALPWELPVVALETLVAPQATPPHAPVPEAGAASVPQVNHDRDAGPASGVDRSNALVEGPQGRGSRAPISPATIVTLLLVIWGLGALYLVARLVLGAVVLGRVVRRGIPLETPDWRRPLLEAADRLALPDLPLLVMSDRFPMPFACGLARPAIVLPSGAAEWDDRRRRTVLVHELAHVSRRDLVANAVGQLACALYWFHPLVWIAARKLRIESERACDDLVLGVGTRPSEYADHLLQIVCRASRSRTPAVALPMAQRHEFEGRMLAILERVARREPASGRHAAVLGALALGVVIPLAALAPVRRAPALPSFTTTMTQSAPDTVRGAARPLARPTPVERQRIAASSVTPSASASATQSDTPSASPSVTRVDTTAVIAALTRALDDSVASVREDAAYALGQLEAATAVEPLAARLGRDVDAKVREMIAWALGSIGSLKATPALGAAAQRDAAETVRAMAVWALGQLEDPTSVPILIAVLRDRSAEVRGRAAWALGSIEPPNAPPALVEALGDLSAEVRLRAAWALGHIADSTVVARLGVALRDSSSEVRQAALWALGQIGGDAAQAPLLQALQDRDPEVRARAARALAGSHGDPWPWPWPMPIIR
jgi:HEAT repeat protein/beta-lactamase regulating signal transducer with metallopeptidase domain